MIFQLRSASAIHRFVPEFHGYELMYYIGNIASKLENLNLEIRSGGFEMKSALEFFTIEAGAVGCAIKGRLGAVPIAHGDVALCGQRMMGKLVLMEEQIHLCIRPIQNGIDFECSLLLLRERPVLTGIGLRTAQAADPNISADFAERAVHWLDFCQKRVAIRAFLAVLPEISPQRLDAGGGNGGLIDAVIEREFLHQLFGVAIGLGKEESGINGDHGNFGRVIVDEFQHHRSLQTEARACDEAAAESLVQQLETLAGAQIRELSG